MEMQLRKHHCVEVCPIDGLPIIRQTGSYDGSIRCQLSVYCVNVNEKADYKPIIAVTDLRMSQL